MYDLHKRHLQFLETQFLITVLNSNIGRVIVTVIVTV